METMELLEFCRRIAGKTRTTQEEKDMIRALCKERGIELNEKCPSCYIDAAAIIYAQVQAEAGTVQTDAAWVLRPGVDILFGGVRINAATITDELAAACVSRGLALKWFSKHPAL